VEGSHVTPRLPVVDAVAPLVAARPLDHGRRRRRRTGSIAGVVYWRKEGRVCRRKEGRFPLYGGGGSGGGGGGTLSMAAPGCC
jgi:hypothetical protein